MRYLRKLTLLAVMAAAAMAMMAGTAAAQTPTIEVTSDGVAHCDPVCTVGIHAEELDLEAHVPFFGEIHQYTCENNYTLEVDENGEGHITNFAFEDNHPTPNPCADVQSCEPEWPGHADEVDTDVIELVASHVCIETPLVTCEGDFTVPLDIDGSGRVTGAESNSTPIEGTPCEITGDWTAEDPVFVSHL